MPRVLIVDDERNVHYSFRRALSGEFEVDSAHDGDEALAALDRSPADAVLLDVRLGGRSGLDTLEEIRARHPGVPVIVMTAYGTVDTAIRATALSAREYLLKPVDVPALKKLLLEVLPEAGGPRPAPVDTVDDAPPMIGRSRPMQDLFKTIGLAASADATVLLTGESGTGKEVVARAIHQHGKRRNGPLVAINCAAIPATLLESELFGHERGAFTGADVARPGKFEVAHGGTLLLDEIGEMEPLLQAKLLRVLQGHEVMRLGGAMPRLFDVRVIAMTNADLEARVASGAFREDLYYRLNVIRIGVPPLRDRAGDVSLLADHFLARESARLGRRLGGFSPEAAARIRTHRWPGNVRELENAIAQACLRARGDRIRPEDLSFSTLATCRDREPIAAAIDAFLQSHAGEALAMLERAIFEGALAATGGNQVRAARLLGTTRNVVRKRMERYGL